MCNLNHLCSITDGSCNCFLKDYLENMKKPSYGLFYNYSDAQLFQNIMPLLLSQTERFRELAESISKISSLITSTCKQNVLEKSLPVSGQTEEAVTEKAILEHISSPVARYRFIMKLSGDIPRPAYKDRAFSLAVNIVDMNGMEIKLQEKVVFKVMVFTAESPVKQLMVNTSGDKAVLGSLESEGDCTVIFKKIIIKEVTSHFRNGYFFLAIKPENADYIKPLVISDLIVKARKMVTGETNKRKKMENLSLNEDRISEKD
ncbi:hypothetical protein SteCoe_25215 [Stentor coeruleus]|uniref:Uncharacterized protein n=1 Tax=Stentor coeruleus TaxID=5963 RepID=A0A1R2BFX5_9CILI|nr:hypothetical protein SteCoe_25215 [Stentor coeruleus]